jgi:hypothetical protein
MRLEATLLLAALLTARSASGYLTSRPTSSPCHRPNRLSSSQNCDANRLSIHSYYSKPSFILYAAESNDPDAAADDDDDADDIDFVDLKTQLLEYLAKRKEVGADDLAAA